MGVGLRMLAPIDVVVAVPDDDLVTRPVRIRHRILVVDDRKENLLAADAALSGLGAVIVTALSGEEALKRLLESDYSLVLLDIQMPGIDGFEVCKRLRAYRHLDTVPIVFLTARKTVEDVRACMRAGGNDFMVKPFDIEKLQARIRHWVATRLPTG